MRGPTGSRVGAAAVLRPGQVVGDKYRVDRLLAEGGMAAVWAGSNQHTGKQVALKVILPIFAAVAEAMELFRREVLAASRVNHPNVVNIFDVIDHDGMTCIVMELLDGETLASYLAARGPLSVEEAVVLLLPAMRGVGAANARGIIHRDLKPGNLFLCRDPEGRWLTTKVLDFGISMSAERSLDAGPASGGAPVRFGTPAYMAPEDIDYPQIVDSRTDVYGFGVLLFEVLTGQLPFAGEPSEALWARILREPPPQAIRLRPDLPRDIQLILDCALAKDPSDRFPDVPHLVRAIEDHVAPPLPVQRSLSPIAGTALLPRSQAVAGAVVVPGRAAQALPLDLARPPETLVFGPSSVDESQAIPLVAVTSAHARGARRGTGKARRFALGALLERRTAGAALLVGTLLVSPWIALHPRKSNLKSSAVAPLQPVEAVVELGPRVTPLAVETATGAAVAISSGAPSTAEASLPAMAQASPSRLLAEAKVAAPVGGHALPRGQRTARSGPALRRPVPSQTHVPPGAGRLSPSDF